MDSAAGFTLQQLLAITAVAGISGGLYIVIKE